MHCTLLVDVIVGQCPAVLELLTCEHESLLVSWDTLSLGNQLLEGEYRVSELHVRSDAFTSQGLYKNLRHALKDYVLMCSSRALKEG